MRILSSPLIILFLVSFLLTSGCSPAAASLSAPETTSVAAPASTSELVTGAFGLNGGNNTCNQRANALQAMRFHNLVATGTLIKLELLFETTTPVGKVRLGIYADKAGVPGQLLLDAGETDVTNGWVAIASLNLAVTQNNYYWLAFNLQNDNVVIYQDDQPANSHFRINDISFGELPSTFPDMVLVNNLEYAMRATVTGTSARPEPSPLPAQETQSSNASPGTIPSSESTSPPRTPTPGSSGASSVDPSLWSNRINLTIDHTKVSSALHNFPVLVHLSQSSGISREDISSIFNELGANSRKIAITTSDGTTMCYIEIEKWDYQNRQAWLWVKVPQISNTSDTVLYLYYDKNQVDNDGMVGETGSVPAENVWSDNFVMVQHFDENASGVSGEYRDSTSRHNDGTGHGVPALKPGKIGGAQFFDGDNDYVLVPDSNDFSLNTTGGLTVSWWFGPTVLNWRKNDGSGDYINMLGKGGYPNGWEWSFGLGLQTSRNKPQHINFYAHNASGGRGIGAATTTPYNLGDWIYVVGRLDKNNVDILDFYPTGLRIDSNVYTRATGYADAIIEQNTWSPLSIGTIYTQWQMFEGLIDEVHISSVPRSDAWIKTSFYSESDNLIIFRTTPDRPPVLGYIGDKTVSEGQSLTFSISATDLDNDPVTYTASNLPPGASFDASSHTFSWTPTSAQAGSPATVHFEASDGQQTSSEDVFIRVIPVIPPVPSNNIQSAPNTQKQPGRDWGPIIGVIACVFVLITLITAFIMLRRKHQKEALN